MKNLTFLLALLAVQSQLTTQKSSTALLISGTSVGRIAESVSSFAQSLLCSVIYLGLTAIALMAIFAWGALLGQLHSGTKTGPIKSISPKPVSRPLILLLFAGLSLAQCKIMTPNTAGEGCPASARLVHDKSPEYRAYDCECICISNNPQMPQYLPICKYCGRHMNPGF